MRARDQIGNAHQNAVINDFISWLNSKKNTKFKVVKRPDPPDAIISDSKLITWVEHCDLYRSGEEARSELSFIIPGEEHKPHSEDPIVDPDNRIAQQLVERMRDKLSKCSYAEIFCKYGRGYLVISERDPLFNSSSLEAIDAVIERTIFSEDKKFIKEVYLAVRGESGINFYEVNYYRNKISMCIGNSKRYLTNCFSRSTKMSG